jgi:SAM-dependent methyltransferase
MDEAVRSRLPEEAAHLDALHRMRSLAPYFRWTLDRFRPWLGKRVLDAGCGIGNATELLARDADYVLAIDLSPRNLRVLEQRFQNQAHIEVRQLDLALGLPDLRERRIDTVVCLDVLEHIEDDARLLAAFYDVLQPRGHLLVKVPACHWLYGSIDVASGHYRRYERREICDRVRQAGFRIVAASYMNVFGVVPYFIKCRVLRRQANFSQTFAPWQLRLLAGVIPALQRFDDLVGPPIGQSVIVAAQKPGREEMP